jgi:hypothetical protein
MPAPAATIRGERASKTSVIFHLPTLMAHAHSHMHTHTERERVIPMNKGNDDTNNESRHVICKDTDCIAESAVRYMRSVQQETGIESELTCGVWTKFEDAPLSEMPFWMSDMSAFSLFRIDPVFVASKYPTS